jgi:uncharacterized protein (TIGR03086 family)
MSSSPVDPPVGSPIDSLARALEHTARLVEGVPDDQWDRPTPCAGWSVRDLVDHLVAGNRLFARALLGEPPSPGSSGSGSGSSGSGSAGSGSAGSPVAAMAYRESADTLLAAFASPGVLERPVTVPFGTVPGVVALHLRLVEALVHGWDLARATGQRPSGDEAAAEQALAFTRPQLGRVPAERSPFGPPQPVADDAPALDRLAACLGREVGPGR